MMPNFRKTKDDGRWNKETISYTKKIVVVLLVLGFLSPMMIDESCADDAKVLPKGVGSAQVVGKFYKTVEKRYDEDGDEEDIAEDYNSRLDSSVFPSLGLVELGFGLPPGSASIGDSVVTFDLDFTLLEVTLAYGITDRLSAGVKIPYWWVKNNVDARLDTSNATVGKNPLFGTPGDPFGVPIIPISLGGVPLDTEDVQDLLGNGLDINGDGTIDIPGFGYKRVKTWTDNGLSDIEAGLKYQYVKTEDWRLAFSGAVRFPTGEVDDPDILQDYSFGKGAYALLFQTYHDYIGIDNLLLNTTLRYYLYFSDHVTRRISEDVDNPITRNKERVERNVGDIFEAEITAKYELLEGFNLMGQYKYGYKVEDDVDGDRGLTYETLEEESDYTEHVYKIALSYSTIPLYMEKKFPLPLTASVVYRNRFAGMNLLKSQYVAFGLQVFF